MAGILEWIGTPEGQGLLSAAFGGLAGAQRGTPWNNAGRAGMAGIMGYGNAIEQQKDAARQKLVDMQVQQGQMGLARSKREGEFYDNWNPAKYLTPAQPPPLPAGLQVPGAGLSVLPDYSRQFAPDTPLKDWYQPADIPAKPGGFDRQAMMADLLGSGVPELQRLAMTHLMPKDLKPELVEIADPANPGRTVKRWVTPGESSGVYVGGTPEKTPEGMRYDQSGQLVPIPGYLAMKKEIAGAGAPKVSVPVSFSQEKEEAKTVGKGFGEMYVDLQKGDMAAAGKIARYDRMAQLLNGVYTGKLTPLGTDVSAYAKSLGFDIDPKLGNKQAADALANEMALQLRNPAGGAGMPGALSDKDREFLVKMTPGLGKDPQSNQLLLETSKKLAQRERDVARLSRDYRKRKGSLDEGFYDELAHFSDKNPLFPQAANQRQPAGQAKFLGFE